MSLNELRNLAIKYPKNITMSLAKQQIDEVKASKSARNREAPKEIKRKIIEDNRNVVEMEPLQDIVNWKDLDDEIVVFEKASEMLPPVEVATETSLNSSQKKICFPADVSKNNSLSDEEWLTTVARGLLLSKSSKIHKRKYLSIENDLKQGQRKMYTSLAEVKQGERHSCKVVNLKLKEGEKYIVGEVCLSTTFLLLSQSPCAYMSTFQISGVY